MTPRKPAGGRSTARTPPAPARPTAEPTAGQSVNEVRLVGRVASAGQSRTLPSGDVVTVLRVVVPRPDATRRTTRTPTVDTVECAIWTARLRQRALALPAGSLVEIDGSLRRRFWRTPGGPASRYEVEVRALRRVVATALAPG